LASDARFHAFSKAITFEAAESAVSCAQTGHDPPQVTTIPNTIVRIAACLITEPIGELGLFLNAPRLLGKNRPDLRSWKEVTFSLGEFDGAHRFGRNGIRKS
jgi:hypothetical protein